MGRGSPSVRSTVEFTARPLDQGPRRLRQWKERLATGGSDMARKKTTTNGRSGRASTAVVASAKPVAGDAVRFYTLEVFLIGGPMTEKFTKKNPVVSRTILIRGDQTLED